MRMGRVGLRPGSGQQRSQVRWQPQVGDAFALDLLLEAQQACRLVVQHLNSALPVCDNQAFLDGVQYRLVVVVQPG